MKKLRLLPYAQLGIFLLLRSAVLIGGVEGDICPPPSVPVASTYLNVTKGYKKPSWKIKYICDQGRKKLYSNFQLLTPKISKSCIANL